MTDKPRRFDLRPADWISGLAGRKLGAAAWGVYAGLILMAYDDGLPALPEAEAVERLSDLMDEDPRTVRAAVEKLIRVGKVSRVGGELEPRKVRDELERAGRRIQDARENGSRGGRPRKEIKEIAKPEGFSSEKLTASSQPNNQTAASSQQPATPKPAAAPARNREFEDKLLEAAKIDPARWPGNFGAVAQWRNAGCTDDDILAGVATVAARASYRPPGSLNYFRQAIDDARDQRRASEAAGVAPPIAPARMVDVERDRRAKLKAATDAATEKGLKPGYPGWPKAEAFGLCYDRNQARIVVMPGWKPEAEGTEA
jgi:hypothetical protein